MAIRCVNLTWGDVSTDTNGSCLVVPVVLHRWAALVWFNLDFFSVWNDPLRVWDSWNVWGLKDSQEHLEPDRVGWFRGAGGVLFP